MHKHSHKIEDATQVEVAIGDAFRIDGKRMTVIAIDDCVAWLKDDCGAHYERRLQQIAQCGKYVVQSTDLPGYPIAQMPEDGKFYLVSVDGEFRGNPGAMPCNLCRRENGVILSVFGAGVYCGATHYHPFTLTYPACG